MTPTDTLQEQWFTSHLLRLMDEILDEPAALDEDGSIPIRGASCAGYVFVRPVEPWGVHVQAHVASGVPDRVGVLRELNAANQHHALVTVCRRDDGTVLADALVLAEALTVESLAVVIGNVLTVGDQLGPVLTAVHGGWVPVPAHAATAEPWSEAG